MVFTTIQKFLPEERGDAFPTLSERRNIVVIADEAHRSQYGLKPKWEGRRPDLRLRQAHAGRPAERHLPRLHGHAHRDEGRRHPRVFGDYIDIYDIQRAVEDGATVPSTTSRAWCASSPTTRHGTRDEELRK